MYKKCVSCYRDNAIPIFLLSHRGILPTHFWKYTSLKTTNAYKCEPVFICDLYVGNRYHWFSKSSILQCANIEANWSWISENEPTLCTCFLYLVGKTAS